MTSSPARVLLFVILGIVAVVGLFIAGIFGVAMFATSGVADAGDKFMNALKSRDYTVAWSLCTEEVHSDIPTVKDLETMITQQQVEPVEWSYSSRNIENNEGELAGSVTFANKTTGSLSFVLRKTEGTWKIRGFRLRSAFATEVNRVAESFLVALKRSDYAAAWSLCDQAVHSDVPTPEALSTMIRTLEVTPATWSYDITKSADDAAGVQGNVMFADSGNGELRMVVKQEHGVWRIQMFRLEREVSTQASAELDTVANTFMGALKKGDFAAAWNQCSPETRPDIPTPDALAAVIMKGDIQPAEWSLSGTSNSINRSAGSQAVMVGEVTFQNGEKGSANIILQKESGGWRVRGFHLSKL